MESHINGYDDVECDYTSPRSPVDDTSSSTVEASARDETDVKSSVVENDNCKKENSPKRDKSPQAQRVKKHGGRSSSPYSELARPTQMLSRVLQGTTFRVTKSSSSLVDYTLPLMKVSLP